MAGFIEILSDHFKVCKHDHTQHSVASDLGLYFAYVSYIKMLGLYELCKFQRNNLNSQDLTFVFEF